MEQQMSNFTQLDDYINWVIQNYGMTYVINNYKNLRDQFYNMINKIT